MATIGANERQQPRIHAIAVALPVQGHMNPMMHLATKLAAQGMVITIVNVASNHTKSSSNPNIRFKTIPDRIPVPVGKLDIFASVQNRQLFRQAYEAMEGDLEALVKNEEWNPPLCCMIGDVYIPWFPSLAIKLQLRAITFSTTNASSLLVDIYIPRLVASGDIPITENADEGAEAKAELPGLPSRMRIGDLPIYFSASSGDAPDFARRYVKAQALAKADWVFVNTNEALEAEALAALRSSVRSNVLAIGPLGLPPASLKDGNHDSVWEESRECLTWLDGRSPASVLYVSFGSIATISDRQFVEIAHGLADSGQAFLWAIRPNLVHGDTTLGTARLDSCVSNGQACIIPWAPQLEVLAHRSVGGFLTHCGWNSLLEAICFGVPLLGWPREVEQTLNCRIVSEWKIGTGLPSSRCTTGVTREEIAGRVKELIVGNAGVHMRKRVAELGAAVLEATSRLEHQLQDAVVTLAAPT